MFEGNSERLWITYNCKYQKDSHGRKYNCRENPGKHYFNIGIACTKQQTKR